MEFTLTFNHYNINIADRDRSVEFYEKALGLRPVKEYVPEGGAFTLTYLADGKTAFRLELTCLKDHPQNYDLGENETHLAMQLQKGEDYEALHEYHRRLGIVCYENPAMGIYFIEDPDGYWIEILPPKE